MVAVGAIIENQNTGKLLLLKRTSRADFSPGIWEEITGRMKQGEELDQALRREISEEAGLTDIKIVKPLTVNHFYRGEKKAENEIILIIYWCKTEEEIITLSGEHEGYKWIAPDEALKIVDHPGVKNDIETFMRERAHNSCE